MAPTGLWAVPILLPFLAALTLAPSFRAPSGERGSLYLGLGDSLTEGVGATRLGSSFMDRFFDHVRNRGTADPLVLVNRAIGGETSGSFIWGGQLEGALTIIGDRDLDTRAVVLSLGGNDLLELLRSDPCASDPASDACRDAVAVRLAGFAANYTQLLGRLRGAMDAYPGESKLIVIAPYNPFSGTGSVYETATDRALLGADLMVDCAGITSNLANAGLNDLIACIGVGAGAVIVDTYEPFYGRGVELTNMVFGDHHPNDAGHAAIAEALIRVFESAGG